MNQIYQVVWSRTKGMYVVVSEVAKRVSYSAVKASVVGAVVALAVAGTSQAAFNEVGTGVDKAIAYGSGAQAQKKDAIAIGTNALAGVITNTASNVGSTTIAIGASTKAEGTSSVAIGGVAYASRDNGVAIGVNSKSLEQNTVAIGSTSNASGQSAVAIGQNANASSNRSTAIGANSSAGWYATAIGSRAVAAGNSVAIGGGGTDGSYAQSTLKESVAVGSYARTSVGVNTPESTVVANQTSLKLTGFAGGKLGGNGYVFSVGAQGKERQIQNVAAGQITATSTDAINGSQLYSLTTTVGTMADTVKAILGGTASVAETGAITMYNIGGTNKNTVEEAIKAAKTEVVEGKNVTVTPSTGANGQSIYTVAVKDDITLNSVTTGTTKMDATGLSIGDKNYVSADGLNANDQVIKNVGAGSVAAGSKDAVNGDQLNAVEVKVNKVKNTAESLKTTLGGNAVINDDGSVTVTNIGGTGKDTIDEAIRSIKSSKTKVEAGKNVTVTANDDESVYTVAVKDDITLNSITAGTTKVDATGLSIGDKNYVSADGLNANNQAIKNVGNGAVTADSTEAVNGAQLHTVDEKVTELGKKVAKVKNTAESLKAALGGTAEIKDDGSVTVTNIGGTGKDTLNEAIKAVKTEVKAGANVTVNESTGDNGQAIYTVSVNKDLAVDTVTTGATKVDTNGITIDNKQFVTKDGINANNTKVTNVANGTVSADSKDAVNGSQLHEVKESIESVINQKMGDINSNTEAINNKIDGINQTVNGLESRVNGRMDKAVAGAAALAALHPLDFDENDKWNIAAGYGNYRSGSALALGAFYRPNEDTMFSIGGAMGNGQNMVNVGVSLKLGQHNGVSNSRKAMAKEIDDLKAQLQAQDEKIAMLIQAMSNAR